MKDSVERVSGQWRWGGGRNHHGVLEIRGDESILRLDGRFSGFQSYEETKSKSGGRSARQVIRGRTADLPP